LRTIRSAISEPRIPMTNAIAAATAPSSPRKAPIVSRYLGGVNDGAREIAE
jgi:hypothetical protein